MPLSVGAGTAIAAGLSTIGNAVSAGNMNRKNRNFQREMYQRQKQDNIEFWRMQNAYNDPKQQMARMKAAGLNPALMYQQGNTGNAGSISSASFGSPSTKAPSFDAISNIPMQLSAIRRSNAQTNLVEEQANLSVITQMLEQAKAAGQITQNERSRFDLGLARKLEKTSLQAAQARLDKLRADTKFTLDSNERAFLTTGANLRESFERILNYRFDRAKTRAERQQILANAAYLRQNTNFKRLQTEMLQRGQSIHDPLWQRYMGTLLGDPQTYGQRYNNWKNRNTKGNTFFRGLLDGIGNSLFGNQN